jgi:hypothetical protein
LSKIEEGTVNYYFSKVLKPEGKTGSLVSGSSGRKFMLPPSGLILPVFRSSGLKIFFPGYALGGISPGGLKD